MVGGWLYGAPGVLIGQAAGGVIFAALAWWLALRVMAKARTEKVAPRDTFSRQSRLIALLHLRR